MKAEIGPGTIVVFGGRSEIGVHVAARLCAGRTVVLAARPSVTAGPGDAPIDGLEAATAQLIAAGATAVVPVPFEAGELPAHGQLLEQIVRSHGRIAVAVVAFGILGDQARAEVDATHAAQIAHVDYVAQVSLLTELANLLRAQPEEGSGPGPRGIILAFSSVAGVRVRRANYVYGSAKAGLDGFLQGLTDALHGSGVQLTTARPGFVVGAMTRDMLAAGIKPAPFSSDAPQVADAAVKAVRAGKRAVWVPRVLQPIYAVLRFVPQSLWRRMPR